MWLWRYALRFRRYKWRFSCTSTEESFNFVAVVVATAVVAAVDG